MDDPFDPVVEAVRARVLARKNKAKNKRMHAAEASEPSPNAHPQASHISNKHHNEPSPTRSATEIGHTDEPQIGSPTNGGETQLDYTGDPQIDSSTNVEVQPPAASERAPDKKQQLVAEIYQIHRKATEVSDYLQRRLDASNKLTTVMRAVISEINTDGGPSRSGMTTFDQWQRPSPYSFSVDLFIGNPAQYTLSSSEIESATIQEPKWKLRNSTRSAHRYNGADYPSSDKVASHDTSERKPRIRRSKNEAGDHIADGGDDDEDIRDMREDAFAKKSHLRGEFEIEFREQRGKEPEKKDYPENLQWSEADKAWMREEELWGSEDDSDEEGKLDRGNEVRDADEAMMSEIDKDEAELGDEEDSDEDDSDIDISRGGYGPDDDDAEADSGHHDYDDDSEEAEEVRYRESSAEASEPDPDLVTSEDELS